MKSGPGVRTGRTLALEPGPGSHLQGSLTSLTRPVKGHTTHPTAPSIRTLWLLCPHKRNVGHLWGPLPQRPILASQAWCLGHWERAAGPEGQCPGRQGSWDSPLWRARPQGLGCVSGGLQSPPQLLAYQRPQPPSAHRPSQGPLSDRSSLCSKASSSKQPPDRLRPALMSVTTPAWLVLHPREGWGEGSRAPGESFGCGAAGLGPWHRGVGGRGGGRGRGATEAQCSRSRRPRPSGPQRHRARSLGPRAPSQAEHREGRGLAALTSPRL